MNNPKTDVLFDEIKEILKDAPIESALIVKGLAIGLKLANGHNTKK